MNFPSGDTRGERYAPGGAFSSSAPPFAVEQCELVSTCCVQLHRTRQIRERPSAGIGELRRRRAARTSACPADAFDDRYGSAANFQAGGIERRGEQDAGQRVDKMPGPDIPAIGAAIDHSLLLGCPDRLNDDLTSVPDVRILLERKQHFPAGG